MAEVSAVVFAKNHHKVAAFYREALGLAFTSGDDDHSILGCGGFRLTVHQIPGYRPDERDGEPQRRGNGPIRLDFPVDSIDVARSVAARLGGRVDDSPPPWAAPDARIYLGHDPEGNVFMLSERAP